MALALRASTLLRFVSRASDTPRVSIAFTSSRLLSTYPTDRRYNKSHEWAKLDGDVATVGITDHAQEALGDIVFVELPELEHQATAGEVAATVESVKAAGDIYAPFDGKVVGINEKLEGTPQLINKEPHDDGWMFQIKMSDPAEYELMMDAETYESTLEESD